MQDEQVYKLLFQAIQEGSVTAVQKAASSIFESAISVTDTAFRVLAADTDPGSTDDMLETDNNHTYVSGKLLNLFREHNLISSLTARPHETILVDWGYFKQHPHLVTGIFWKEQILGIIVALVDSADYTKAQDEALQACADALALVMHTNESGKKKLSAELDHFISKLFHGAAKQNDLKIAAQKHYFLQSSRYVILATEFIPNSNWQEKISQNPHLLFYRNEGIAYLLANAQSTELQELQKWIENRGYRFGMSYCFCDPLLTDQMAKQAAAVLRYGNHSGLKKADWPFPKHVLEMLVWESSDTIGFVHPSILEIEQYDAQNNTEYLKTLQVWLLEKMDYSNTAKAMHLHRNSLYYRMQRIQDLFSLDLSDMNTNVQLYLCLCVNNSEHPYTQNGA